MPFALLAVLTLGTGLAIGLGLSEGPVTYTATSVSPWAPCSSARHGAELTVMCRSVVSQVTPTSFTYQKGASVSFYESPPRMPKDFRTCMSSALIHVVPRTGPISSVKLNREMTALYDSCSGSGP